MLKIYPKITAAIGATKDRLYVRRYEKGKIIDDSPLFYNSLVKNTGKSGKNNLIKVIKNWHRAYKQNLNRLKLLEEVNDLFFNTKKGRL